MLVKNIKNDNERIQKSKNEFIAILDRAVELNMNAVFFQVSPEGDAFYESDIVPWSQYLTGTFGKDPGFDPLHFSVEEAHKLDILLSHCVREGFLLWTNTCPGVHFTIQPLQS